MQSRAQSEKPLRSASDHNGPGPLCVSSPGTAGETRGGKHGSVKRNLQKHRGHALSHREQEVICGARAGDKVHFINSSACLKGRLAMHCSRFDEQIFMTKQACLLHKKV